DRNRSHWSTSKTPSYTKSVSWQHHLNPGIIGYKIVFGIMACFAFCGAVVSVMLVKRISQRKKEMLAAEA
ncbi:hypothetical protein, partial [Escherichia coli]|uniref:hypothetical protein n=1 Tax=Escherichia coli TaxID=562 RepID=UPI002030C5DA